MIDSEKLRGKISIKSGEGFGTGAAVARLFQEHDAKVAMIFTAPVMANAGLLGVRRKRCAGGQYAISTEFCPTNSPGWASGWNAGVPSRIAMAAESGQAVALISDSIQDATRVAFFLASDESRSITGD